MMLRLGCRSSSSPPRCVRHRAHPAATTPEARDMALHRPARPAGTQRPYQPLVREQNGRWILYVGHHGGTEKLPAGQCADRKRGINGTRSST
jgi:hypothetical protein